MQITNVVFNGIFLSSLISGTSVTLMHTLQPLGWQLCVKLVCKVWNTQDASDPSDVRIQESLVNDGRGGYIVCLVGQMFPFWLGANCATFYSNRLLNLGYNIQM